MMQAPAVLGEALRAIREFPARNRLRRELRNRSFAPPLTPVIALGERERQGLVHGGRVKLLQLERRFPRDEDRFSVLYLVSSAIPPHAEELVHWAKRQGAVFVWNQNGVGFPAWAGARTKIVNRPMVRLIRLADHAVYQSEFCQESAVRYLGEPSCPSSILYNPVDLERFRPVAQPPLPTPCRLLAAGTHNQAQRVLGLLETAAVLRSKGREVMVTIAGAMRWPGADAEVRATIERLGLRNTVTLVPAFTQEEAVTLLRDSHALVHLKYHDPCPTMVIEALACGVPVIGSRTGGMPELVGASDACGELLPVEARWETASYPPAEAIAAAVERVMTNWTQRSVAARARAEQLFGAEPWLDAHESLFQRLLARGNRIMET